MTCRSKALFMSVALNALILAGAQAAQVSGAAQPVVGQSSPPVANRDASSDAAQAQDTPVAEIVVTAQKREERLSDVPLTITAVTGAQLAKQGITSADQLERVVPAFSATQTNSGEPVYTLRGVGFYDTSIGSSPAVAIYSDQVPVSYSAEARGVAFDLNRIEVLNGPQGTLFGQNATGGAINFIAAKPTKTFTAGASLDYGSYNEVNGDGFVSGPIAPGLTFRLAARTENSDDWQKGYAPNDRQFGVSDATLGSRRFNEARLIVDYKPTEKLSLEVNLNGWHDGSDTQAHQFLAFSPATAKTAVNSGIYAAFANLQPVPNDDRLAGFTPGYDYGRDDYFYQGSLRADYHLTNQLLLTSITSYSGYQENSTIDEDGTAFFDQETTRHAQIHTVSEELRTELDLKRLKVTTGLNYEDDLTTDKLGGPFNTTSSSLGPFKYDGLEEVDRQNVKTYAGFADVDYRLTDQIGITLGGRYTKQDRGFEGCVADDGDGTLAAAFKGVFKVPALAGQCVTLTAPGVTTLAPIITSKLDQDNFSWKVGVNWKPTSRWLLYANITKGYKAGSFPNVPAAFAVQYTPVTQESVIDYEAGFKTQILERRLELDGAAFYYDYTDKQLLGYTIISPFGKLPTLVNIPKSRIYGLQVQAVAQPIRGLRASVGATYVNSRVDSDPSNPEDPFGNKISFVGDSFPDTPEFTGVTDVEYRFPVLTNYEMYIGGGTDSRSNTEAAFGGGAILNIHPYTLLDLRAGFQPEAGPWSIQLWARNTLDQYYTTNKVHDSDAIVAFTGRPRTVGVTLRYSWQ